MHSSKDLILNLVLLLNLLNVNAVGFTSQSRLKQNEWMTNNDNNAKQW